MTIDDHNASYRSDNEMSENTDLTEGMPCHRPYAWPVPVTLAEGDLTLPGDDLIPDLQNLLVSRSEVRRDGGRRRNTSGPRPLSLADGADPWHSLGLEHGQDGQEVSYGQLLVPSKHFLRERKMLYTESDVGDSPATRHHPVARY